MDASPPGSWPNAQHHVLMSSPSEEANERPMAVDQFLENGDASEEKKPMKRKRTAILPPEILEQ